MAETRTELSDNPSDYLTGPSASDHPTEGGTQKDGTVVKVRSEAPVRQVGTSEPSES